MYYCKIVILLKRQLAPMMVWHNDEGVILVCRSGVRLPAIHCDVAWLFTQVYICHQTVLVRGQLVNLNVC